MKYCMYKCGLDISVTPALKNDLFSIQSVICEGASSSSVPTISGVPQGTVLGLLLFLLYVNDLPDDLESSVRLFADDTLLYATIANDEDTFDLQDDLRRLEISQ